MTPSSRIPTGAHGGDRIAVARFLSVDPDSLLDLSQSLNPIAPLAAAIVGTHLDSLSSYPDATRATHALAEAVGVPRDQLLLTNGGAEAIALVADHLPVGDIDEPEFSLYRRHLRTIRKGAARWRSNPQSPLGLLASPEDKAAVWDEAFFPLTTGVWTRGEGIVLGSLTKLLACPGLRLGYVIASPDLVRSIADRQPRWSVSGLASESLPDLLDTVDLPGWSTRVRQIRTDVSGALEAEGLRCRPGDAPWILADVSNAGAARDLLARSGLLVRDCTTFGLPRTIRIGLPDATQFDRLLRCVQESIDAL